MSHLFFKMGSMARQLHLAVEDGDGTDGRFRIDARTKAIGRKGLAKARAALAKGRGGASDDHDTPPSTSTSTRRQRQRKAA